MVRVAICSVLHAPARSLFGHRVTSIGDMLTATGRASETVLRVLFDVLKRIRWAAESVYVVLTCRRTRSVLSVSSYGVGGYLTTIGRALPASASTRSTLRVSSY